MKRVAILQSNYIPWKGYFDLIGGVDEFILYDEMQYTKNDWRNRNKIKTTNGLLWLTIPVVQTNLHQRINETKVLDNRWAAKHLKSFKANYAKAKSFKNYEGWLTNLYEQAGQKEMLSDINYLFIIEICKVLNIQTKISWSNEYKLVEGKTERLVDLCQQVGATEYISGPAAKDYIQAELFTDANIELTWMDYSGYSAYNQLHGPFEHGVSVLDLILNEGEKASSFMKATKLAV